jgi:ribosomal protein S18 acetylase RimI-like enzyme
MERALTTALPDEVASIDLTWSRWDDAHAVAVHRLMVEAYRAGGGTVVADFTSWHRDFVGDCEFDGEACFLDFHRDELAGAALCWDCAFVKDICVSTLFRRRGVATTLLVSAMRHFRARGFAALRLKVDSDNPSGALRLYERLGFLITSRERT